jgi:hypothetical protein
VRKGASRNISIFFILIKKQQRINMYISMKSIHIALCVNLNRSKIVNIREPKIFFVCHLQIDMNALFKLISASAVKENKSLN